MCLNAAQKTKHERTITTKKTCVAAVLLTKESVFFERKPGFLLKFL